MVTKTETQLLTGKALLQKLQEIPKLSRSEKARECGYVSLTKDGQERVNIGTFLNAVLHGPWPRPYRKWAIGLKLLL
ncbi:MAG: hypothetical protein WCD18_04980 [Thermosynechococcaceae cyanobacterium]